MADLEAHSFSATYSGLLSTFWVFLGIGGACLIGHETLTRIPRRRGREGPLGAETKASRRKGATTWTHEKDKVAKWKLRKRKARREDDVVEHGPEGGEAHELRQITDGKQAPEIEKDINNPAWRAAKGKQVLGSRENWEFKYLYEARAWNGTSPSEPLPKWPLLWIWYVLSLRERDLPARIGIDCTVHSRFLRACVYYTTLHVCTTMPILLPIHIKFALPDIATTSMLKAGVTVDSSKNISSFLWVHVFLLWYMLITWVIAVWWVITGGVKYRKAEAEAILADLRSRGRTAKITEDGDPVPDDGLLLDRAEMSEQHDTTVEPNVNMDDPARPTSRQSTFSEDKPDSNEKAVFKERSPSPESQNKAKDSTRIPPWEDPAVQPSLDAGFRQYRTVLVSNIPPSMRDDAALRNYFEKALSVPEPSSPLEPLKQDPKAFVRKHFSRTKNAFALPNPQLTMGHSGKKKGGEVKPEAAIPDATILEECEPEGGQFVEEIVLVRKLQEIDSLRKRREGVRKRLELAHYRLARRVIKAVEKMIDDKPNHLRLTRQDTDKQAINGNAMDEAEQQTCIDRQTLIDAIRPFTTDGATDAQIQNPYRTVWDALHDLREQGLLDPYQALTRKKLRVRQAKVPLIDLLTTQYKHLDKLLQEKLAQPIETYRCASSAFVTFKDAKTARRVLRELKAHPHHVLSCRTRPAPQHVDLIWPKLVKSVYRAAAVRSWVINFVVWVFTILWVFPLAAISAVASVSTAAQIIPALGRYLEAHPSLSRNLENLVPVILVGLISLAVCPILLAIANHESHIVTGYGVHDATLSRYWKYLVFNPLIVFCVGRTALQSYVFAKINTSQILNQVASAFPAAAPYFAGAIMYNTAIQVWLELVRLGLPLIAYVFARRPAVLPRQRQEPQRTASWFFLVPNHMFTLLLITEFAIFNPLVLPFALVYFCAARVIYTRNFLFSYGRRYENSSKRNGRRYLRYSLDGFVLAEFSWLAFMILAKQKVSAGFAGVLIPLTVATKLILTRVIRHRHAVVTAWQSDEMDKLYRDMKRRRPLCLEPVSDTRNCPSSDDVVQIHPPFPRWVDVPVVEKTTPYRMQPMYHDPVEDFLWLPRDPLSRLDLDDTVEFRSFLVTTQGDGLLRSDEASVLELPSGVGDETEGAEYDEPEMMMIGAAVEDDDDVKDDSKWSAFCSLFRMRKSRKQQPARRRSSVYQRQPSMPSTTTRTSSIQPGQTDNSAPMPRRASSRRPSQARRLSSARSGSQTTEPDPVAIQIKAEEQAEIERLKAEERKEIELEQREQDRSMRKRARSILRRVKPVNEGVDMV